jgi:hypothetical protein
MDIQLTPQAEDRFQRLQAMMDTDRRITDTFTDSNLVELAIDVLAIAAVCDPKMTVSELLNLGLVTFQAENEKGVFKK